MNWFCVNTKPKHEIVVEQNLQKLGVEIFCPHLRRDKVIRRRQCTVINPLFPGYLFARFDIKIQYRAVSFAQGVRKLVAFGTEPAVVDDAIIESIKLRMEDGYLQVRSAAFVAGQSVWIDQGPFQGLQAVFERQLTDQERVVLLLRTLAYQPRVIVNLEHIVQC